MRLRSLGNLSLSGGTTAGELSWAGTAELRNLIHYCFFATRRGY
jgi:hypothetical protein